MAASSASVSSELPAVAIIDDPVEQEDFYDARSRNASAEPPVVSSAQDEAASAEPTPEERALLVERVRSLVDFYFGDANFSKDQFLRKHASSDPLGEGWVGVGLVCSFKKMKMLTTDASIVLDGMRKSEIVVLNASEDKIRRKERMENFIEVRAGGWVWGGRPAFCCCCCCFSKGWYLLTCGLGSCCSVV
jgi:hypothetical protein